MSNGSSGDFNLPFDASNAAKEVEKQTKQAAKMLRDVTSYEGAIRAAMAARKRIEGEIIRDAASRAGGMLPPSVRRGQTSAIDPRTGASSSIFDDPKIWGDRNASIMPTVMQSFANRPGAGGPDTLGGKFKEGLDRASVNLERFASTTMLAAGAAMAITTAANAISGYSSRGAQANAGAGTLDLLAGRAQRSLRMDARTIKSMVAGSGDIEGASKFVNTAIMMREQQQLTIPPEYLRMGLTAMRNGASAEEVTGWLQTFQFHKLDQASRTGPTTRLQAQEINRRAISGADLIASQSRASKEQRDFGAFEENRAFEYGQQFPILSGIPGAGQFGKTVYDLDPRSNPRLSDGGPITPQAPIGPRGTAPIRQPLFDVQSGGRTGGIIQVEVVGDRTRRTSPRTGNKE